jgi:serine protease Do
MNYLLRPFRTSHLILAVAGLAAAACMLLAPRGAGAQAIDFAPILENTNPLLAHASVSGYLGVDVSDVDADKAQALKLKEVRGAIITLIDHDAPAGQIGLKINDVVLAINGENVESAEQLRRMLREIPPGRKISLQISRDGNIQTLAVQLVDRKALDHDVWGKIGAEGATIEPAPAVPAMGIVGGDVPITSGFHMSIFTSTLNVGALVEPLTSQMAEYLGVQGGLMVKQVAKKSEAAAAGLKAFDVILKVGSDSITTAADWDRALRSNVGKPVQVTILRDKKQQTVTLQVDSRHRGALDMEDIFGAGDDLIVAEADSLDDSDMAEALAAEAQAQADALGQQFDGMRFQLDQKQIDRLRDEAEKLGQSMKDLKLDPKQKEELNRQMELLRKQLSGPQMKQFEQEMQQFRRQMQLLCRQTDGNFV